MKARDCRIGQHVRDTRTGIAYRVTELRILATDAGAWVTALGPVPEGYEGGLIEWNHLEPIDQETT